MENVTNEVLENAELNLENVNENNQKLSETDYREIVSNKEWQE